MIYLLFLSLIPLFILTVKNVYYSSSYFCYRVSDIVIYVYNYLSNLSHREIEELVQRNLFPAVLLFMYVLLSFLFGFESCFMKTFAFIIGIPIITHYLIWE